MLPVLFFWKRSVGRRDSRSVESAGVQLGYEVPIHAEMGRLSLMHTDEEMASALCAGSPAPCELLDRLGIPLDR